MFVNLNSFQVLITINDQHEILNHTSTKLSTGVQNDSFSIFESLFIWNSQGLYFRSFFVQYLVINFTANKGCFITKVSLNTNILVPFNHTFTSGKGSHF